MSRPRSQSPWRDPGAAGERLEIEEFPSFLLSRLGSLAKTKLTRLYLDEAQLSMPEWRVLTILERYSPLGYAALMERSTMDKGQISLTLRVLVARGWVVWEDAPEKVLQSRGRPKRIVAITSRGRAVIRKILPNARRVQMRLLKLLPRDERVQLYGLLQKTLRALDDLDKS